MRPSLLAMRRWCSPASYSSRSSLRISRQACSATARGASRGGGPLVGSALCPSVTAGCVIRSPQESARAPSAHRAAVALAMQRCRAELASARLRGAPIFGPIVGSLAGVDGWVLIRRHVAAGPIHVSMTVLHISISWQAAWVGAKHINLLCFAGLVPPVRCVLMFPDVRGSRLRRTPVKCLEA